MVCEEISIEWIPCLDFDYFMREYTCSRTAQMEQVSPERWDFSRGSVSQRCRPCPGADKPLSGGMLRGSPPRLPSCQHQFSGNRSGRHPKIHPEAQGLHALRPKKIGDFDKQSIPTTRPLNHSVSQSHVFDRHFAPVPNWTNTFPMFSVP